MIKGSSLQELMNFILQNICEYSLMNTPYYTIILFSFGTCLGACQKFHIKVRSHIMKASLLHIFIVSGV